MTKPKFHFLVHLPLYIRRFGPAILYSTERYESFNHIFRLTNIYSNRQAPSRDTCRIFAVQDIVRHIATGGWLFDRRIRRWVSAGADILGHIESNPTQRQFLGIKEHHTDETQSTKLSKDAPLPWPRTQCSAAATATSEAQGPVKGEPKDAQITAPPLRGRSNPVGRFHKAINFALAQGDMAHIGDHVVYTDEQAIKVCTGNVYEPLLSLSPSHRVCRLDEWQRS